MLKIDLKQNKSLTRAFSWKRTFTITGWQNQGVTRTFGPLNEFEEVSKISCCVHGTADKGHKKPAFG